MLAATREGRGCATPPNRRSVVVAVLDAFKNIASVKVTSDPYVDYVHLAKLGRRWLIVNVLWCARKPR